MDRLDGQVAVITGGASGIGEAAVRLFVQEGARVVIADIQDRRGNRLAKELGENVRFVHTDVTTEGAVKGAIDRALDSFGRLDCMFNNAGVPGVGGPIDSISVEGFDTTVTVLLRAAFLGMKHAAPVLKAQGSGTIISTASIAGLEPGYAGHIYSAAKAGIIQLTRSVALELREFGVRVNCICPGYIATPMFSRVLGLPTVVDETVVETLERGIPDLGQMGRVDDVARAALWLASEESHHVNGHALVVDNGGNGGVSWSSIGSLGSQVSRTPHSRGSRDTKSG